MGEDAGEERGPEEKQGESRTVKEPKSTPCPVYPSSVTKIMGTVAKLDKGEIDEFGAVEEVTKTLREHREAKLAALARAEKMVEERRKKEGT